VGIRAGEAVNETSLRIGEYEALKDAALDPYVMIRNAYVQNRNKLIAE
jgi:phospholipid-binding lipoprotein MlaA